MKWHQYLNQFHSLSSAEYALLTQNLRVKSFKKGEVLVAPGQIQREMYFVKSGVQMSYFDNHGKNHVLAFTYAPNLCAVPDSFSFQKPSKYFLSCVSDSELASLSFNTLQDVLDQSPAIERLYRVMSQVVLVGVMDRHVELQSRSMEERYVAFCQRSPHLLQQVPHKYIASYLNIDPTNFSKLYNTVKF